MIRISKSLTKNLSHSVRRNLVSAKIRISIVVPSYNRNNFCFAESGAIWALEKAAFEYSCAAADVSNLRATANQQKAYLLIAFDQYPCLFRVQTIEVEYGYHSEAPSLGWFFCRRSLLLSF
jgi:hypothetical protein